ncbi:MAG: cyclic nucleotide-binding domain-containing protein, partial [Spirochaetia bacterium]|nr:cyclic nucleotide-binding domain-containing protein [Spirochaetia bacterium]
MIQHLRTVNAKDFREGDEVFREGDMPDDTMYFLLTGEVAILKNRPGGSSQINSVHPGSFFGEMALVAQRPRLATARVISPSARAAI